MSARVVTAVTAEGTVVAEKRPRHHDDAVRLRHEAEVLGCARHPGVVELVSCQADNGDVVLRTEFVGGHSLETVGPLVLERAAGLVAALADVVADLHELGVVHGRIEPAHILIGKGGRPILCGFGGGGRVGAIPPPGPPSTSGFVDPASSSDAALFPHQDVYGLGCVLRALIAGTDDDLEPIPERRFAIAPLRAPWTGFQRRALLTLADRATDDVASRRPPARRFARDLLDSIPAAVLVEESEAPTPRVSPPRRARWMVLAAIAIGLLALVGFTRREDTSAVAPVMPSPSPIEPESATTTSTTDAVHVEDGRVVVRGAQRFTAGAAGDRVVVGDWDCNGTTTVAVLRPSTGAVFVFDAWATAQSDVAIPPTTRVPGAVELMPRTRGDGCSTLVAVLTDGTEQEIL